MSKITYEYDAKYDIGDVVIFKKEEKTQIGIVRHYIIDTNAGDSVWYNIQISKDETYSYAHKGDISESDILCKIENKAEKFRLSEIILK